MADLQNDSLGLEKFRIDEQLVSLLSQVIGGYARLAFKEEKKAVDKKRVFEFKHRFDELGKKRYVLISYSYAEKVSEIEKFKEELKKILTLEKSI